MTQYGHYGCWTLLYPLYIISAVASRLNSLTVFISLQPRAKHNPRFCKKETIYWIMLNFPSMSSCHDFSSINIIHIWPISWKGKILIVILYTKSINGSWDQYLLILVLLRAFSLPLTLSVEKTSSEFFQSSIFLSHCIFEALGAGGQRWWDINTISATITAFRETLTMTGMWWWWRF